MNLKKVNCIITEILKISIKYNPTFFIMSQLFYQMF